MGSSDFDPGLTIQVCHEWLSNRQSYKNKASQKELKIRERITESLDDRETVWASVVDDDRELPLLHCAGRLRFLTLLLDETSQARRAT